MNIYVGNLPYNTQEDDLQELFSRFGPIASVAIIKDPYDGRSRGFGFVEMEQKEDGEKAVEELNGQEFMGRALKINEARPRRERNRDNRGGDRNRRDRW